MFTLITGGSASGKSEYAEQHAVSLGGRLIYVATMQPYDDECLARIAKHQSLRSGRGFQTLERYTDLAGLNVPDESNVLLECLGNLTANELYSQSGGGDRAVILGIEALLGRCRHLTVVTNEIFSGGADYEGDTLNYMRALAAINRRLARRADMVVEVVAGCPNFLKGAWQ